MSFGDAEAAAVLLRLISDRKDLGETLSKGIRHAARVFSMEDQAVHVKGMEPMAYII
ncbi:MAG: hypothetical protein H8D87_03145 [Deltaproteobacteria bacterium]|uniref:aldehyde ferredoxin oxidoreductase C-terminal domain-containing protein n=1 Tax=Desulfobacula sp. TaxID=2593537 RepID=UPI001997E7AE|nr:hypothetical protein [Candidatus Desulfobacula maris]MBL6995119.1 hypothetical protein [Desulfobacula sp.]